jgi:hypothetical protein
MKLPIICEETYKYNITNNIPLQMFEYFIKDHKFCIEMIPVGIKLACQPLTYPLMSLAPKKVHIIRLALVNSIPASISLNLS